MIFPGMDPYLEDPVIGPEVHNRLIVYMAEQIQPLLRPRYVAAVEARVYIEGPERKVMPDVSILRPAAAVRAVASGAAVMEMDAPVEVIVPSSEAKETYLQILDLNAGQRVVAVVEVVSPSNKYAGTGRDLYVTKQQEVLESPVHLIEVDLLRHG